MASEQESFRKVRYLAVEKHESTSRSKQLLASVIFCLNKRASGKATSLGITINVSLNVVLVNCRAVRFSCLVSKCPALEVDISAVLVAATFTIHK